jgi:CBS domain-containing protein
MTSAPTHTLREAAKAMAAANVGALAVMKDRRLVGIITERDLVSALAESVDPDDSIVEVWMTMDPDSLDPDMEVEAAADWMLAAGYRHLPVVEGANLVGIISIKDVLWAMTEPAVP